MSSSTPQSLRVAIIGAGPAGFYAADQLLKSEEFAVMVHMYDRLPTPYGLVRAGVAPDHEKIRNVTRKFDATADHPNFRFFGNVDIGRDVSVDELKEFYHMILFTTGAQVDRRLNIEGEDLRNCHSATEFVAWYNGHPDYADLEFDLSQETVVVIGVGNVAVDVARILCRTPEELATTDIADYALDALSTSNVKDVYMLGRRGPAQAAFTNPEIKELGEMTAATAVVLPDELELDALTRAQLEANPDRLTEKKLTILGQLANAIDKKSKRLHIRFLVSPTRFVADENGAVRSVDLVHNTLVEGRGGRLSANATSRTETLEAGLVFKSVGYRGVPIPGVPFNDDWGVVRNDNGRITADDSSPLVGLYAAGWIKRGATGVIGTNKACAAETVRAMLEDAANNAMLHAPKQEEAEVGRFVRERQPDLFTYDDWKRLDALESGRGEPLGRPRVKLTSRADMIREILEPLRT